MFGFWVRTNKAYSAQCPACEQTTGIKHIETLFNGVNRYRCKFCNCIWLYRKTETEVEYADVMNGNLLPEVLTA